MVLVLLHEHLLLFLPVEDTAEQLDVLDGKSQNFVLTELLLRRVGGDQLT